MTLAEKTFALGTLTLALAVAACAPAKIDNPSYAKDVAPIFAAHCARCHTSVGVDGGLLPDPVMMRTPAACRLDFYDGDPAICAVDGGGPPNSCYGAHFCATSFGTVMKSYISGTGTYPMPPPPSSLMNDWERDVVDRWISNPIP